MLRDSHLAKRTLYISVYSIVLSLRINLLIIPKDRTRVISVVIFISSQFVTSRVQCLNSFQSS